MLIVSRVSSGKKTEAKLSRSSCYKSRFSKKRFSLVNQLLSCLQLFCLRIGFIFQGFRLPGSMVHPECALREATSLAQNIKQQLEAITHTMADCRLLRAVSSRFLTSGIIILDSAKTFSCNHNRLALRDEEPVFQPSQLAYIPSLAHNNAAIATIAPRKDQSQKKWPKFK